MCNSAGGWPFVYGGIKREHCLWVRRATRPACVKRITLPARQRPGELPYHMTPLELLIDLAHRVAQGFVGDSHEAAVGVAQLQDKEDRARDRERAHQKRHRAHGCGFAAVQMPRNKTVIGGEPFRGVFLPARQLAGARKGRAGFRRLMSLGPDQRVTEARL
jgi:hypothetical protein